MKLRILFIAAIVALTAACQPTGRQAPLGETANAFASVRPSVPAEWGRQVLPTGAVRFACSSSRCSEYGEIRYSAMKYAYDYEPELRQGLKSGEMKSVLSTMRIPGFRQITFRDISNKEHAGYRRETVISRAGESQYTILELTASGDTSYIVSATAPTQAKVRQYFQEGKRAMSR